MSDQLIWGNQPSPWQVIADAWCFAKPLADTHESTTSQRKIATEKLAAAAKAAAELAAAGEIAPVEGDLLAAAAESIRVEMLRNPSTDARVKCHKMAFLPPARRSLDRLRKRLPLLESLAAAGKISPAVAERVLPTIRADLATLASEEELDKLQPEARDEVAEIRAGVQAAMDGIDPAGGALR